MRDTWAIAGCRFGRPVTCLLILVLLLSASAINRPAAARSFLSLPGRPAACISGTISSNQTYSGAVCFELAVVKTGVTVTLQNATIDSLTVGEISSTLGNLSLEPGASLEIFGSTIGTLSLYGSDSVASSVSASGNGIDFINIYSGAPLLEANEIYASLSLKGRTAATVRNNIFYGKNSRLAFLPAETGSSASWDAAGPSPIVTGNSFLGNAPFSYTLANFPPTPINIGGNYFGGENCTVEKVLNPRLELFDARCSSIGFTNEKKVGTTTVKILQMAAPQATGSFPVKDLHLAEFWLETGRPLIGQHTLMHNGYPSLRLQGRPTLLTFSPVSNRQSVAVSEVYATVDGKKVNPIKQPGAISRDCSGSQAPCAVDIILPPVNKDKALVELFVVSQSGTTKLWTQEYTFDKPYTRPLVIAIRPVQIMTPFYNHAVPNAAGLESYLYATLPALFPIGQEDLLIITLPTERSYTGSFNLLASIDATAQGLWNTLGYFSTHPTADDQLDLVIALVACNNIGQEGGASYPLRRGVIFVEECRASAVFHEMGHAYGLNTIQEQYNQYPETDGRPLTGATLFLNSSSAWVNGFGASSVLHLAAPDYAWRSPNNWTDIMGASPDFIWPSQETLDAIYSGLTGSLGTKTGAGLIPVGAGFKPALTKPISAPSAPPAPGYRRLFLYGETAQLIDTFCQDPVYTPSNPLVRYRLQPGTVWAMDLTPLAVSVTPPAAIIPPDPFFYCYANYQDPVSVYYLDADGEPLMIENASFAVEPTLRDVSVTQDYWYATLDAPEAARAMRVESMYGGERFLELTVEEFSTQITAPSAGATLPATLTVKWNTTPSGSQPLRHLLFYRTSSAASWQPLSGVQTGNSFTFATTLLPASNTLSILLLSSNGLRSHTSQVDGLRLGNHPPQVTIFTPLDGDVARPATPWSLRAFAIDREDGPLSTGSWNSSLDGPITVGSLPTVTLLSQGVHRLAYSASDSKGLSASSTVTVTVAASPKVDLGWLPTDLSIVRQGMDPIESLILITPEITHTLYLGLQNTGVPVTGRVSVYLQDPEGVETLLLRTPVALAAFERWNGSVAFIPKLKGSHHFRAVLDHMTPTDSYLADNQRTWEYTTQRIVQIYLPLMLK